MRCSASSLNPVQREHRVSPSPPRPLPITSSSPLETAVDDVGGTLRTVPSAIIASNHQNKAEADLAKEHEWCDVIAADPIFEMSASSVAIAAFETAKEKRNPEIASGRGVSKLAGTSRAAHEIHWTYDTYALWVGTDRTIASLPGDTRNGGSGEFIEDGSIVPNSFHRGQSGDHR
jgi:hypothetical protein